MNTESDKLMELYLQDKRNIKENGIPLKNTEYLKADNNATLSDFISMLSNISSKALQKSGATLDPDEGRILGDVDTTVEHPIIIYSIISSIPKFNIKKHPIQTIVEKDNNPRICDIYIQEFMSTVQFNIVASEYKEADTVLNDFMDLMINYSGYFKKNGVSELIFEKRLTDKQLDIYRQHNSIRSVQYKIGTQKINTVFNSTIQNIQNVTNET